jgi:hypothetical protein
VTAPGIAWEDTSRGFFDRLWSTVRDTTMDPVETFRALGSNEDVLPAVRLALACSLIGHSPALALVPCIGIGMLGFEAALSQHLHGLSVGLVCAMLGAAPFVLILGPLAADLVYALVFHGLAKLAGGTASFSASLRAMLYTGILRFWMAAVLLLFWVPFLGGLGQGAARAAVAIWSGACAYGAAQGVHGIRDDHALMIGVFTPVLSVLVIGIALGVCALGLVALFAGTFALELPWNR